MHSSAHADTLAKRANGAVMLVGHTGNHQRLGRFASNENHTIPRGCNLESYAEGGIAFQSQNAAKTDRLDRFAWAVNDRSCETAADFSYTPSLVEVRATAGLMLARVSTTLRQNMSSNLCSTHPWPPH
jgi:hypothetical protein